MKIRRNEEFIVCKKLSSICKFMFPHGEVNFLSLKHVLIFKIIRALYLLLFFNVFFLCECSTLVHFIHIRIGSVFFLTLVRLHFIPCFSFMF